MCVYVGVHVCVCEGVYKLDTLRGSIMSKCLDYCIDATLNTFQHSYPLYYCISCMWCYSCQKEHIYACSNLPFLSFDRVLSTVEPTGLQAAHCNILLISAQPLLSVDTRLQSQFVCDCFTDVILTVCSLSLDVFCLMLSYVFFMSFECCFRAKKVTMLVPKVFFIPSIQRGE